MLSDLATIRLFKTSLTILILNSIFKVGYVSRSGQEKLVSEKDMAKLRTEHPNLHRAVTSGTLLEANGDFVEIAKSHPQETKN